MGRRKLLVALPDEHKLVLLDAQHVLDQEPGTFTECEPEATFALDADVPKTPLSPILPDELKPAPGTDTSVCLTPSYPAPDASLLPTPGGFGATADRVYVADRTRPVVHVLDATDPCSARELPPLLPYSYTTPDRVVTTSRLAVSPLSPSGQQFVYAVDQDDQPTASVMVFDLAAIAADPKNPDRRTPKVFDGAPPATVHAARSPALQRAGARRQLRHARLSEARSSDWRGRIWAQLRSESGRQRAGHGLPPEQ